MTAMQEMEILNEAMLVGGISLTLYFSLLWLNKGNRTECYAPVELSGILCIIPEILTAIILTLPSILWVAVFSVKTSLWITIMYLGILFVFRDKIISKMIKI